MNEKNITDNILSHYTISIRVGNIEQQLDMVIFTALCNKFQYNEICEILAQSPTYGFVYTSIGNKIPFTLIFSPQTKI